MTGVLKSVADTISQKPEIGIFGSMAGVALSPIAIISLISAILGLFVTLITLIIKVIDIAEKMRDKKGNKGKAHTPPLPDDDDIIIDNKRYRRIIDEDQAE